MTALGLGLGGALSPLGLSGTLSFDPTYSGELNDGAGLADTLAVILVRSGELSDTFSVLAFMDAIRAQSVTLTDTVGTAQTDVVSYGPVIVDMLRLSPALICNSITSHVFADEVGVAEALAVALPVLLSEGVGLAPVASAQVALTIADELGILPTLEAAATYHLTLTQTIGLADSLAQFFEVVASDTVTLEATATTLRSTYAALADTAGIEPTLTPLLMLRVGIDDEVGITPSEAISMIYSPVLSEEIEIAGAFLSLDGAMTTWVMNTRTGAVTEYDNYEFNSFARVGNRYLGASADGLYDLRGDDDAGEDIIAELKGAFLQFGGTHLSRLKSAFIAMTGVEDVFALKIETLDGVEYVYECDARSGRSSQFHMGKGQRSRYFAYTLTSSGQDFNLDTLEFVPLVVKRRV